MIAIVGAARIDGEPRIEISARTRKMMSRGAYLAACCLGAVVREVGWTACGDVGCFLGVGASGGSLDDVTALLAASIVDGAFSLARFGDRGLAACNPLLAFQLMNNFTLAHAAIQDGLGGPNSALFSRGAGTTAALVEAIHAIERGDCSRAIAGGADSALHPVTRSELVRDGFVARGLVPAEGAAMVALAPAGSSRALAIVEHAAIANGDDRPLGDAIAEAVPSCDPDAVVIVPWGPEAGAALREQAKTARVVEVHGDALAAAQAIGWTVALDAIAAGAARVLVLGAGTDGDVGAVVLRRPA